MLIETVPGKGGREKSGSGWHFLRRYTILVQWILACIVCMWLKWTDLFVVTTSFVVHDSFPGKAATWSSHSWLIRSELYGLRAECSQSFVAQSLRLATYLSSKIAILLTFYGCKTDYYLPSLFLLILFSPLVWDYVTLNFIYCILCYLVFLSKKGTLCVYTTCAVLDWPDGEEALSQTAYDTINLLLTSDPVTRPCGQAVKLLPHFCPIDWDHLLEATPPFVPQPESLGDTSYFQGMYFPFLNVSQLLVRHWV